MAAFGERLTVYLGRDAKMNVNTDEPAERLLRNARIMADPPSQPIFSTRPSPTGSTEGGQAGAGGRVPPHVAAAVRRRCCSRLGLGVNTIYTQANSADVRGAFTDRS